MWKNLLRKIWLKGPHLFFDAYFALCDGGLDALRRLTPEILTFRFPEKRPKKKPDYSPFVDTLESRDVPSASIYTAERSDDPRNPALIPIGEVSVDPNLGAVRINQALDFDLSPNTDVGGNPYLVFNSATVDVRPIIQVNITPDGSLGTLTQISLQLTWNGGSPQSAVLFTPTGSAPYATAVQVDSPVSQTGRYDWSIAVELTYTGGNESQTVTGRASVVVQDSSVSGQQDPFGAGWGIAGVDRLVPVTDGLLWVYGTGESDFFASSGSDFTSPPGVLGTLVQNTDGTYAYTAIGKVKEEFDANGLETQVVGTNNLTLGYRYDLAGRLTQVDSPDGSTAGITFDGNGLLQTINEPGSRTVNVTEAFSGGVGTLTKLVDGAGYTRGLDFDADHHLVTDSLAPYDTTLDFDPTLGTLDEVDLGGGSVYKLNPAVTQPLATTNTVSSDQASIATLTDPLTRLTNYELDEAGRMLAMQQPSGASETWGYDLDGLVTSDTDADNNTSDDAYDIYGQLTLQQSADGAATTLSRDGTFYDNVTKTVQSGSSGNVTTTAEFDSIGEVTETVSGNGGTTLYGWANGRMTSVVDPIGGTSLYNFDDHLRVTSQVSPNGAASLITYGSDGNILVSSDANGNATTLGFDGDNRMTSQINPAGDSSLYQFDAAGLDTGETIGGISTSSAYNQRGLMTASTDGNGSTMQYMFDVAGENIATIDQNGNTSLQSFDQDGNATLATDPNGFTTQYAFDKAANVTKSIDSLGGTTLQSYDKLNRVTLTVDSDGNSTAQQYDLAGNVSLATDGAGASTRQLYDLDMNVTASVDGNGKTTLYSFDKADRLTLTVDPDGGSWTQAFDKAGNVTLSVDPDLHTTLQSYDPANNLTKIVASGGFTTLQAFDQNGRLTKTTDPDGRWSQDFYDNAGNVTKTTDNAGHTSLQAFDNDGQVTLSTDPLGFTTVTLYDKNGNVTETIDARGDSSLQAFDKDNRLTLSTDPNGHTVLQAYNQAGGMTSSIDGNGNTTTYYLDKAELATAIVNGEGFTTLQSFDKDGRLTKSVDADNFTVSTAFDQNGQVIQMTDGAGHATAQQYDPAGRLTKTTDGAGATRLSLYDPAGIVTASVDGNGYTTQYALDPAGRVTLTTDPNGNTMLQGFDPAGLVTLTTDGNGNTMQQQFDPSGLLTEVIDGDGHAQLYSFDADGRMALSQDADSHTTQQKYDQVGNLTATIDGNGVTTGQRFDKAGLMTATIDGGGNTTLYQFDAAGNETLVADPYGHGTSYAFNKANQLTKLTDADANATSYVLDGVGNATIVIDPNMNRTTQQFDGDHQVTQQITGRMNTLSYGFDGVGRPTSSPNGSFGYNKEGQLTLASNSYGAYSLTYDDGGRVTLVTEPDSLTLSFGYDKAGNRTLVTDSLGGTELSTYDDANFLTSRMYQGQGQILGVQFTNNAEDWNTTLARYGNGTLVATGETSYDNVGQATTILNTHGTATVDQFLNAYNNGNVTSVIGTQNGSTTTLGLTYDEDNELTVAGTTSYTFDSNGNRTGSAGVTTGNELTSDATWTYTYDADGNLIQKSKGVGGTIITIGLGGGGGGGLGGGETWTYGYNPQDQLTQVQHFTGPLITLALTVDYGYDAFGNRIETTSIASGTTTVTKDAYDGWDPGQPTPTGNENFNVWAQTDGSGTLTSRYMYSDRVDQQLGRIDVTAGTATVYWTLEDYQNSVRDVIDNTGALKDSIQYDAFGNITSETDPTYRGSYAWTGRELDAETDLQYNRARWYDATTGRWMTEDPLGFDAGDSNLYRYAKNAPTEATDPSGLQRGRIPPRGSVNSANMSALSPWGLIVSAGEAIVSGSEAIVSGSEALGDRIAGVFLPPAPPDAKPQPAPPGKVCAQTPNDIIGRKGDLIIVTERNNITDAVSALSAAYVDKAFTKIVQSGVMCNAQPSAATGIAIAPADRVTDFKSLADVIMSYYNKNGKQKFNMITIWGHAGGSSQTGMQNPGVVMAPNDKGAYLGDGLRFDLKSVEAKKDEKSPADNTLALALETALAPGGTLRLMSCGYKCSPNVNADQWENSADKIAQKLKVRILIADGKAMFQTDNTFQFYQTNGKDTGWYQTPPK